MCRIYLFLIFAFFIFTASCGWLDDVDADTFEMCSFGMKYPCGRYFADSGNPDFNVKLELVNKLAESSSASRDTHLYIDDITIFDGQGQEISGYSVCFNAMEELHCTAPKDGGPDPGQYEVNFLNTTRDSAILHREDERRAFLVSFDNPQDLQSARIKIKITLGYYQSAPAFTKYLDGEVRLNVG
jgi:hypothetical protein